MSAVVDLVIGRITDPDSHSYEGFEADVYDDANDQRITCIGQPTVGYGSRVRQWSKARAINDIQWVLNDLESSLTGRVWYQGTDVQKSVLLEIAFNQGLTGLTRYPRMLAYCAAGNFTAAASECTIAETELKPRYAALAELLK